ncbi:hypothetical protein ACLBOM_00050 [Escherichia coli]
MPRGLMPNPKVGTVAGTLLKQLKTLKLARFGSRNDKNGIIHTTIGKVDFDADKLKENLEALLVALKKAKPTRRKACTSRNLASPPPWVQVLQLTRLA